MRNFNATANLTGNINSFPVNVHPPAKGYNFAVVEPHSRGEIIENIPTEDVDAAFRQYGAVLFRGFVWDLTSFRRFARVHAPHAVFNESDEREIVDTQAIIQTVNRGAAAFPLHPELARVPWRPDVAIFACDRPSREGGRTTLCDGAAVVKELSQETLTFLSSRKFRYRQPATRELLEYWLETETPSINTLRNPPPGCPFRFEIRDSKVFCCFDTPALYKPPYLNEDTFGSFMLFARYLLENHHFPVMDDDEPIPPSIAEEIKAVSDRLTVPVPWQKGDVAIVDNWRFMHGRQAIIDPEDRRILTYFGYRSGPEMDVVSSSSDAWRQLQKDEDWNPPPLGNSNAKPADAAGIVGYRAGEELHAPRSIRSKRQTTFVAPDLTIPNILSHPALYFFDIEGPNARFRPMSREAFRRSVFLDQRIQPDDRQIAGVPLQLLLGASASAPKPKRSMRIIFHIAHCGSTLLANGLDQSDKTLVLREPYALRQIGVEQASNPTFPATSKIVNDVLAFAVGQYSKQYSASQTTIIKANVPVNFVASELLDRRPAPLGLMLHLPLDSYLLAVLKSKEHQNWVVNVTRELGHGISRTLDLSLDEIADLTIPRAAAMLWSVQIRLFDRLLKKFPKTTRSLDAENLFKAPAQTLQELDGFFGTGLGDPHIRSVVEGHVFNTNAKRPGQAYTSDDRERERARKREELAPSLNDARDWFNSKSNTFRLPKHLARPLIKGGSLY